MKKDGRKTAYIEKHKPKVKDEENERQIYNIQNKKGIFLTQTFFFCNGDNVK